MTQSLAGWLTAVTAWLPEGGWQRMAADAIWQSALIAAAALLLARTVRERAAVRAAVALLAAGLCIATPILSLAMRTGGLGMLTGEVGEFVAAHAIQRPAPLGVHAGATTQAVTATLEAGVAPSVEAGQRAWRVFGVAWLVLCVILAWRLTRCGLAVHRMCRAATPCEDAAVLDELERAATKLGVRPPRLLTSDEITSPALVAWGRPTLLLPGKAPAHDELCAIFCHELAHLARRDGWGRLMLELLVVVLPWQPLVWLLRREFRTSCEEACDDWAVASGCDPVEFAAVLTDFIPRRGAVLALGMAESVPAARHRILRLLAMQGVPQPRLGKFLGVLGWLVALALLVTLAVLQRGDWPWRRGSDLPPWGNAPIVITDKTLGSSNWKREPYRIEPPDVLLIDAVKVVPKPPEKIEALDVLQIVVVGTLADQSINDNFTVGADGTVGLGGPYGSVALIGLTLAEARDAVTKHLKRVLTEPEVSLSFAQCAGKQQIAGEHLVAPDGHVTLGAYGSVRVTGMTIAEAKAAIEKHLEQFLLKPEVSVDIFSYNSKVYYIIVEDGNESAQVLRFHLSGNETVLDALVQVNDLSRVSEKYIWIARPVLDQKGQATGEDAILPVNWDAIVKGGSTSTNWQLAPGDRLFVRPKK